MTPYDRLKQLGLELLTPAVPVANYVPFVFANGFLYLSGHSGLLCTFTSRCM